MKKKLLIVNSFYYPDIVGGAEISTKLLAEDMIDNYNVYVLTVGDQKKEIIREMINNVYILRLPNLNIYRPQKSISRPNVMKLLWHILDIYNPRQFFLIKKIIKEIGPDIIHTQNLMGVGTYIWSIASQLSIPVVHTLRDYALINPVSNKILNNMICKINLKRSRFVGQVTGVSQYVLEIFKKKLFFPQAEYNVVHNIVHTESYIDMKKTNSNVNPSALTLGYFGQLEKIKGINILLDSIKKIDSSIVKKIVICGNGSQEEYVDNLSKIDKRIIYLSKVPYEKVQAIMGECDLTIVPSCWNEPFGRVVIESYRQGTPVVASNVGGIPEIIISDIFLCKKNNSLSLKDKIVKFYSMNMLDRIYWRKKCYKYSNEFLENKSKYNLIYNNLNYS